MTTAARSLLDGPIRGRPVGSQTTSYDPLGSLEGDGQGVLATTKAHRTLDWRGSLLHQNVT